ncbi:hypothetical protein [Xenorhabdus sp. Sc-CR9]|uniref:hypothetical protein n=1 Tax=Xenorhabdus sp. Sc-CR9 TaxID=2584468 RepID=UPI001F30C700|nr:hypothetical protein [Xenorhabdus sp. Sc-CR9]
MYCNHVVSGVVFSAIFSGVIGGILWVIQNKKKISKKSAAVIFIVTTISWNLFYFKILRENNELTINNPDSSMLIEQDSIFLTIKNKDPKLYNEFKQIVSTLQKKSKSKEEIQNEITKKLISLTNNRILFAPDKNVISHIQMVIKQMGFLQKESADKCLKFIFPDTGEDFSELIKISILFPPELYAQRVKTDKEMIIASYGEKQHQFSVESSSLALQDIEHIMIDMVHKYGEDIALLESPHRANTNKEKSCKLLIDLNKRVVELPPEKSARIYRYFMSQLQ